MILHRQTIFIWIAPWWFVETDPEFAVVDLARWGEEKYDWTQDPLGGAIDTVRYPRDVLETGDGDCEDYAVFAASVLASRGVEDLAFVSCTKGWIPDHTVLYADGNVYSNGTIYKNTTPDQFADIEGFDHTIVRPFSPTLSLPT
jgi:transglutaminase-like putative cysteine protease